MVMCPENEVMRNMQRGANKLFCFVGVIIIFVSLGETYSEPLTPGGYVELVVAQINEGQYEEAVKRCEEFLQKFPADERRAEILFQLANAHLKWSESGGAEHITLSEKYAHQLIEEYPGSAQGRRGLWLLSGAAMLRNDWSGVARRLREARMCMEDIPSLWRQLKYATPRFSRRADLLRRLVSLMEGELEIDLREAAAASVEERYMLADLYTCAGRNEAAIDLLLGLVREVEPLVREGKELGAEAGEEVRQLGKAYYLLGQNYREVGELREGAGWFERLGNLRTDGTSRASGLIEAARLYLRLGDEQKANELYDQVAQYGNGWVTGVALSDRVTGLIHRQMFEEAKRLLEHPVSGLYSEQVEIVLCERRSFLSYQMGNFNEAEHYANKAIAHYKSVSNLLRNEGLEQYFTSAERILSWIAAWKQNPIRADVNELTLYEEAGQVFNAFFFVYTFQDADLGFSISKPGLSIYTAKKERFPYFTRHTVKLEGELQEVRQKWTGRLQVFEKDNPNVSLSIPVTIRRDMFLRTRPEALFFGFLRSGTSQSQVVALYSEKPFHIISVTPSDDWIRVEKVDKAENECTWEMRISASAGSRRESPFLEGKLHIVTDFPGEEVIELSCYAESEVP